MIAEAPFPASDARMRDREVIRVDLGNERMGIAAALRQAFAAAAHDPSTHDFDKLLSDLN